jgi:hypothetical protein
MSDSAFDIGSNNFGLGLERPRDVFIGRRISIGTPYIGTGPVDLPGGSTLGLVQRAQFVLLDEDGVTANTTTANNTFFVNSASGSVEYRAQISVGDLISLSSAPTTFGTVTFVGSNGVTLDTALGDGSSQTINVVPSIAKIDDSSLSNVMLIDQGGAIGLRQNSTPSFKPPSGYSKLYFKGDGNLYSFSSAGVESVIETTNSFTTVVPTAGTNVVATTPTSTLTLTSADSSILITGSGTALDFKAVGGSSGANQFLNNLSSPTAINQDLLPGTAGAVSLGSASFYYDNMYALNSFSETLLTQGVPGASTTLQQSGGGIWQQNGINYFRFSNDNVFGGNQFFVLLTASADGGANIGGTNFGRPNQIFAFSQLDSSGVFSNRGYQIDTSGAGFTINNSVGSVILNNSALVATATITMPAAPVDGQYVTITCTSFGVTALTIAPNGSQTVYGAPTSLSPTTPIKYQWVNSISGWVRC